MSSRAQGKRAVVIGGGQMDGETIGNGRACAVLLAREGAEVCVVDRYAERARATVDQIEELGAVAHPFAADVSSAEECERLFGSIGATMDGIDILVNNVGINSGDATALQLSEEVWDTIIDTNLKGMWLTSRHVLPLMREQGGGVITNISSTASLVGFTPRFAYGVSKAGVNALTHALARENAPWGIRVNAVLPGSIETPLGIEAWMARGEGSVRDEIVARRARSVPMGHMGTAWDIAHAVLFLSSDDASFITGVLLPVDGGAITVIG